MLQMKEKILIGADLGFASIGISVCHIKDDVVIPILMQVIRTKKSEIGSVSEDNMRRARLIYKELKTVLDKYKNNERIMFVEAQSASRDASAAAKTAMAWGVLAALAEDNKFEVIQTSPQKIKKVLCGKNSASKEEVEEALRKIFPNIDFDALLKLNKIPKGLYEHAFDSLGAMVSGLLTKGIDLRNIQG